MEPTGDTPVVLTGNDVYVVSPLFVGSDGEAPTDTGSNPTLTATRADGTVISAAPVVDDPTEGDGLFRCLLLASDHTNRFDRLKLTWSGTISGLGIVSLDQYVDVAGGRYVKTSELRALHGLSEASTYPTDRLLEVLAEVETTTEDTVGLAFVPRFHRERLYGDGSRWLILNKRKIRDLISVTIDGVAATLTDLDVEGSTLVHKTSSFPVSGDGAPNVIAEYSHGLSAPPPNLRRETLQYVRNLLLDEEGPLRGNVISQVVEGMTTRFSTPDPDKGRWTGDLKFDAMLVRLRKKYWVPGFA